jgi:nitrous oxide reductase accessory protein NosL
MTRILVALAALAVSSSAAPAQDDLKQSPSCTHCGMDRERFGHSRMLVEYDDGTKVGLCSVRCAAVDLVLAIDKAPSAILVADLGSRKLIDAEKATWVIGGAKPGVMTKRAKWAFEDRAAAEAFVKEHGGTLASFDEVMKATYEDLWSDTKMIREKRKMARASKATGTAR